MQANVLIDESGHARLTDYGVAPINASSSLMGASPNSRWLAPEIIKPLPCATGVAVESRSADIFAFGMLVIEVLTGRIPFEEQGESRAAHRILEGGRPGLPQNAEDVGLAVPMWGLIQRCWDADPAMRPEIEEVVTTWEGLLEND